MQFLYVSKLELQRRSWDDIVTSQLSIEPFARKHPGSHSHQGGVTPPLGGSDRGVTPTGESRTPLTPVPLQFAGAVKTKHLSALKRKVSPM